MCAYMIRASPLCSDWLLQLVSIGYGRAHQSEFLLIVSREVKGEESALPNNSGEVCPTNFCPRAGHCMVLMSLHTPLAIVCPKYTHSCWLFFFSCSFLPLARHRDKENTTSFLLLCVVVFYLISFHLAVSGALLWNSAGCWRSSRQDDVLLPRLMI